MSADVVNYVVGSGPSGVAAAAALLDHGLTVTMLDVGVECEPERLAIAHRMAGRDPHEWSPDDVRTVRGPAIDRHARLPRKLAFGSAFAYADDDPVLLQQTGTNCVQSHAKGGLSNVWGAAVLPNRPDDLTGWPFSLDELGPHYARVAELMPIAGTVDELDRLFPFYGRPAEALKPSRLAQAILRRLRAHRTALESDGVCFGQSRLAVKSQTDAEGRGCQYTGLCLSGCPYFAIWNASAAVDALRRRPEFTYRPGWHLERIASTSDGVRLAVRSTTGSGDLLEGRRAFIACGPISTARIVIDSLGIYGRPLPLQFQPYFMLPLVAFRGSGNVDEERLHTLAQIFLEIVDSEISSNTVHLQVYTFNEYMRDRLERSTARLGPLRSLARRTMVGRLLAIQGYLHSSEAAPIRMTSELNARTGRGEMTLTAETGTHVRDVIGRIIRKLRRHARHLGALPVARLVEIGRPGEGNHVGGTFPLRRTPGDLETDMDGQLAGLRSVHLVDSSSLPSLAATTFTYTTMAHAHRIAHRVAQRDESRHV